MSCARTALCGGGMVWMLVACADQGEVAAREWMAAQKVTVTGQSPLPPFRDTEPLRYQRQGVADVFSPERLRLVASVTTTDRPGAAPLFADVPLAALRYVGFLQVSGQSVGMVQNGPTYRNVRVGDTLGEEAARVLAVTGIGLVLRPAGLSGERNGEGAFVMKINRAEGAGNDKQ